MNFKAIIIFCLVLFFSFGISGQNFSIDRISVEQGLSQSNVGSIVQDRLGFMWIATKDGLNRYDGYQFKVYKVSSDTNQPKLLSNSINALLCDSKGNLWIGTDRGLTIYDYRTNKSRTISSPDNRKSPNEPFDIQSIIELKDGFICAVARTGLTLINPIDFSSEIFFTEYILGTCTEAENGELWIPTSKRIIRFNRQTKITVYYSPSENLLKNTSANFSTVYFDRNGKILLGNLTGPMMEMDTVTYRISLHEIKFTDGTSRYLHNITQIVSIDSENEMVATWGEDLFIRTKKTGLFTPWDQLRNNLTYKTISCIYLDRSGIVWLGTNGKGVNKLNPYNKQFELYSNKPYSNYQIDFTSIRCFTEDNYKNLWVGGYGGLMKIDPFGRPVKTYNNENTNKNFYPVNIIYSILPDPVNPDILWLGSEAAAVFRFNTRTEKIERFDLSEDDENKIYGRFVFSLTTDFDNHILVGSDYGLTKINRLSGQVMKHSRSSSYGKKFINSVRSFYKTKDKIWFTADGIGLFSIDKNEKTEFYFNPFPNAKSEISLLSLCGIGDSVLLMGTNGGGIFQFNYQTKTISRITDADGLPDMTVYGILKPSDKRIWFSSNKGIFSYNLTTKSYRVYNFIDGLQSNEFNRNAYYISSSKKMYFGGIEGFNAFYDDDPLVNSISPLLALTEIKTDNRSAFPAHELSTLSEVTLEETHSNIEFNFASLDFTKTQRNQYRFRLLGLDTAWTELGTRNLIHFPALPHGHYTLEISGSNAFHVWAEKPLSIALTVLPPFYKTWWFYLLGLLLISSALYALYRYRVNEVKNLIKIRLDERQSIREQLSRDFHDELGHKLAKISLASRRMMKHVETESVKSDLTKMLELSQSLKSSARDLIWSLNPNYDTYNDLWIRLKEFGDQLYAEQPEIKFTAEPPDDHLRTVQIPVEWKPHLLFVFKEAMTNAMKYSGAENISFSIKQPNNDWIDLTLTDDGIGLSDSDKPGNGLLNMKSRAAKISAEIVIQSDEFRGTSITLRLFPHLYVGE